MAEGSLERRGRLLESFTIADRPVYARNIVNDDLARKDEMDDELAELRLRHAKLVGHDVIDGDGDRVHVPGEVDDCDDPEKRRELRAEARRIAAQMRELDALMLGLYVEDENGELFPDEALKALPFRVRTKLSERASMYAYGVEDEEARPTTGRNGSG
jgi:hypothetical protein